MNDTVKQAIHPEFGVPLFNADGTPMAFKPRFDFDSPLMQKLDANLKKIPMAKSLNVIANRANMGIAETLDFLGTDTINEILSLSGSSSRVPSLSEAAREKLGIGVDLQGNYDAVLGQGNETYGKVLETATDVGMMGVGGGGATRATALKNTLEDTAKYGESAARGMARQMTTGSSARDLVEGSVSGAALAGVEDITDSEFAGTVTEFIAPMLIPSQAGTQIKGGVATATQFLDGLFLGNKNFMTGMQNLQTYTTDGAVKILGDAMMRSGKTPDQIMKDYEEMLRINPGAIPADVDDTFRVYLRSLGNKVPKIAGTTRTILNERDAAQYDRLTGQLDATFDSSFGVPGLDVEDEIFRLQTATREPIREAYDKVKDQAINSGENGEYTIFSPKINRMMQAPGSSLARARKQADQYIADELANGHRVTHFDIIDFTKKQIDDEIGEALRKGRSNQVRQLTEQKAILVSEADAMYPDYAAARQLHADAARLEQAAEFGMAFTKGGVNRYRAKDIKRYTDGLGEAELRMFRLGVKKSLLEKMDDASMTADQMRSIYKSRSEQAKIRALFTEGKVGQEQYQAFENYLKTETEFRITRKAATENSSTAMQLEAGANIEDAIAFAEAAAGSPSALAKFGTRMMTRFASDQVDSQERAMMMAGDILLGLDVNPIRLQKMLQAGADEALRATFVNLVYKHQPRIAASLRTATAAELALHFADREKALEGDQSLQEQMPQ